MKKVLLFFICGILLLISWRVRYVELAIRENPPIQKGFIYTQELKEDSTYELIAYPTKDWTTIKKHQKNVLSRLRDYQIDITNKKLLVYDIDRLVGNLDTISLKELIIRDNQ